MKNERAIEISTEPEKPFSYLEIAEKIKSGTRKIKLKYFGNEYEYYIISLDESKKYGSKKAIKMDKQQQELVRTELSLEDNKIFYTTTNFSGKGRVTKKEIDAGITEKIITKKVQGGLKHGQYVNESGDTIEKKTIENFDDQGEIIKAVPSSLNLKTKPNTIELKNTINTNDTRYS